MCSNHSFDIHYPDTLMEIWKYCHKEECILAEEEVGKAWLTILQLLTHDAKGIMKKHAMHLNDKDIAENAKDAAHDLIIGLIKRPLGEIELKTSYSCLRRDLQKQIARNGNPEGYKFNMCIRAAIKALEKSGAVLRDKESVGRKISRMTSFRLVDSPDHIADMRNYESQASTIPIYMPRKRKGSLEHASIITPMDAEKLVQKLLAAFNGWTRFEMLIRAAMKHIPEGTCRMIERFGIGTDGDLGSNQTEEERVSGQAYHGGFFDPEDNKGEDETMEEFYGEQVSEIIAERTSQIWKRVCKISGAEFFCLFHIPKHFGGENDNKPILQDFGIPQTMSDKDKRLDRMWKEELAVLSGVEGAVRLEVAQNKAVNLIFSRIFAKLYGRCTENGYDPHLYVYERKTAND